MSEPFKEYEKYKKIKPLRSNSLNKIRNKHGVTYLLEGTYNLQLERIIMAHSWYANGTIESQNNNESMQVSIHQNLFSKLTECALQNNLIEKREWTLKDITIWIDYAVRENGLFLTGIEGIVYDSKQISNKSK